MKHTHVYKIITEHGAAYILDEDYAMGEATKGKQVFRAKLPDYPTRPYDLDYVEVKATFVEV